MPIEVLLVDDEEGFLAPLYRRLRARRFNVRVATSGQQASRLLQESPADVVVLDVRMPDMDGIATIREIKREHPLVEVILLTGHASLEASVEGMSLGAFDYLLKPVSIDELRFKIEDAYRSKTLQEQKIARLEAAAEGVQASERRT
jgi:DNA-binding NtrC family response regulator